MAVKTYQHPSAGFQMVLTTETKTAHSSGHNSRQQMVPGRTAQFAGGLYATADAAEQTVLDAKATAGLITALP
jgi:hypothetical protein